MFCDFTKLNRLPSLPAVAVRLLEVFDNPDAPISRVADVIQSDPAITVKIMRAANSASYGGGRPITELNRAVNLLGKKVITSLALCFSLAEESMRRGPFAALYRSVWLQSIVQATTAELLARQFARGQEGEFFTSALLANIGSLALLKATPHEYAAAVEKFNRSGPTQDESDLSAAIDRLSAALLEHWCLPERVRRAVAQRRSPVDELKTLPASPETRLIHAAAMATAVGEYFCREARGLPLARSFELAAELYGLDEGRTSQLMEDIRQRISGSADLFETDVAALGTPTELMSDAMEQLSRLANSAAAGGADQQIRIQLLDENGRLKQRIQELVQRNAVDPLTSVFNRGHFDEQLRQHCAAARAARLPIGMLFIDADHFKLINDTYGHSVGDVVLKRLATIIAQSVRGEDLVARYGGEEFVVLVTNPSEAALASLGERVRIAVERERIPVDRATLRVTVSVGGAVLTPPLDEGTAERLLAIADAALYLAKDSGRNCVKVGAPDHEPVDFVLAAPPAG